MVVFEAALVEAKRLATLAVDADRDGKLDESAELYTSACILVRQCIDQARQRTEHSKSSNSGAGGAGDAGGGDHDECSVTWLAKAEELAASYETRAAMLLRAMPPAARARAAAARANNPTASGDRRSHGTGARNTDMGTSHTDAGAGEEDDGGIVRVDHRDPLFGMTNDMLGFEPVPMLEELHSASLDAPLEDQTATFGPTYQRIATLSRILLKGGFVTERVYIPPDLFMENQDAFLYKLANFGAKEELVRAIVQVHVVKRLAGVVPHEQAAVQTEEWETWTHARQVEVETRLVHLVSRLENIEAEARKSLWNVIGDSPSVPENAATELSITPEAAAAAAAKVQPDLQPQTQGQSPSKPQQPFGGGSLFNSIWRDVRTLGHLAIQGAQKGASSALQRINHATSIVSVSCVELNRYRSAILEVSAQYLAYAPLAHTIVKHVGPSGHAIAAKLQRIEDFFSHVFCEIVYHDLRSLLQQYMQRAAVALSSVLSAASLVDSGSAPSTTSRARHSSPTRQRKPAFLLR